MQNKSRWLPKTKTQHCPLSQRLRLRTATVDDDCRATPAPSVKVDKRCQAVRRNPTAGHRQPRPLSRSEVAGWPKSCPLSRRSRVGQRAARFRGGRGLAKDPPTFAVGGCSPRPSLHIGHDCSDERVARSTRSMRVRTAVRVLNVPPQLPEIHQVKYAPRSINTLVISVYLAFHFHLEGTSPIESNHERITDFTDRIQ